MNAPWNYEEMAANMQPSQFELLLRAYVRLQAVRAQDRVSAQGRVASDSIQVTFAATLDRKGTLEEARWRVCLGYGEDTKGEILEPALTEMCRRRGWSESPLATLRLISASPSEE